MQKGEDDLAFAKAAFEDTKFYAHICALCQQAVEKFLKAYIVKTKGKITKQERTHKLIFLAKICKKQKLNLLKDYEESLRLLYEAYIPARYPVPSPKPFTKKQTEELLEISEKIINIVKVKL